MELQYTPYALLIFIGFVIACTVGYAIWNRRPGSGVNAFVGMMIGVGIWMFANVVNLSVTSLGIKIFSINLVYFGVHIVNMCWVLFALAYTGREKWITPRLIGLMSIAPALTMLAVFTNPLHRLFWLQQDLQVLDDLVVTNFELGPLFYVHTIYSYILIIIGAGIMVRAVLHSPQLYRGQIGLLLVGGLIPFVGNIVFIFFRDAMPIPSYVDITPLIFVMSGLLVGWALYRFRLMDIVPVAREVVIDNMIDGIVVVDSETRIVDINDAAIKILGFEDNSIIGKPMGSVWERDVDLLLQFRGVSQANTEVEIEIAGDIRTFNVRLSPITNRRGEVTGRIATLHDVTTLKEINRELSRAREKADEATRLKSDFLATMSHELRTPLNAVIGYSELMLTGMVGDLSDKHYEYTDRVLNNAKYLLDLINDILDISKIEAGRMELVMQPFVLRRWVDEIVSQNRVLADEKGIDFNVTIDEQMPLEFLGDAARLRQIAINLLSNAFKFTHDGSVTFEISKHDTHTWTMIVSDTGVGIPPHKQETIFEEFQQADNSSTREYGGTGLGLAIVRRFVLMMGGHIRLSSDLGEGSTFTVILPLLLDKPENVEESSEKQTEVVS